MPGRAEAGVLRDALPVAEAHVGIVEPKAEAHAGNRNIALLSGKTLVALAVIVSLADALSRAGKGGGTVSGYPEADRWCWRRYFAFIAGIAIKAGAGAVIFTVAVLSVAGLFRLGGFGVIAAKHLFGAKLAGEAIIAITDILVDTDTEFGADIRVIGRDAVAGHRRRLLALIAGKTLNTLATVLSHAHAVCRADRRIIKSDTKAGVVARRAPGVGEPGDQKAGIGDVDHTVAVEIVGRVVGGTVADVPDDDIVVGSVHASVTVEIGAFSDGPSRQKKPGGRKKHHDGQYLHRFFMFLHLFPPPPPYNGFSHEQLLIS